jgi:hypothetical protein
MKCVLAFLLFSAPAFTQPVEPTLVSDRLWKLSVAAVVTANALDAASTYGHTERNPLLQGRNNQFGAGQVAIKFGVVGSGIVVQRLFPRHRKVYTVANFITAGVLTGLAVRNYRM